MSNNLTPTEAPKNSPLEKKLPPRSFNELDLPAELLTSIKDLGFTELTAVQQIALPLTLAGKDVAGQGRTGTGKTATFLITAIHKLLRSDEKAGRKPHHPRAIIVAPTRELAIQIAEDGKSLTRHTALKLHTVYGGVDYEKQKKAFEQGVDILIGTPGRLIDFFKQQCYALKHCDIIIVDEADRMFDLGFIKDLRYLMRRMPPYDQRQALLFSATLSHRVMELAYEHMNNPKKIRAEQGDLTAHGIEESVYHTAMDEKIPLLIHLLRSQQVERGMIFINEKRTGEKVARKLAQYGFRVGILSGDVRQKKRMRILEDFSCGKLQLLVATDVASRGIHVNDVSHVFNYDLPEDAENYVHRIGRTARAGSTGTAISFACERHCFGLPDIETFIKRSIPLLSVPQDALEIGEPVDVHATAEGMQKEDRAETHGDRHAAKPSNRQQPGKRRPRRSSGSKPPAH